MTGKIAASAAFQPKGKTTPWTAAVGPEPPTFPGRFGILRNWNNFHKRALHKLAEELNLPKLSFQVIRLTVSALPQKRGTVKDAQGVMRHSRVATITDVHYADCCVVASA